MRFFHVSDLHIGLKLHDRDLLEDQKFILEEIARLAEERKPGAVVIAGDIYDKAVPSAEAVALFDHFIDLLTAAVPDAAVMMISGNHDSAPRIDCFRDVLKPRKLYMIGEPPRRPEEHIEKVTLTDECGPVNFWLLPFVKPSVVKAITGTDENGNNLSYDRAVAALIAREDVDSSERNVLVSHQFYLPEGASADSVERMDSEILTVGNIDEVSAKALEPFDYAALGHIHKPMRVGSEFRRYSGTPLACSVSEAGQKKHVIEVTLEEKGKVRTEELPLKPLREVRVLRDTLENVLKQASEDYVQVTLTDKEDLNAAEMRDRLHAAFPNLLEIRRENERRANYAAQVRPQEETDPFELCCDFLSDADEVDREILRDVLNAVRGGEE